MVTIADSIQERYNQEEKEVDSDYVFIMSVSSSPHAKQGKLPCLITLIDYKVSRMGSLDLGRFPTAHIKELDLSDNLISDWTEVDLILKTFSSLTFLSLARNLLSSELIQGKICRHSKLSKLILNGNQLSWDTVSSLLDTFPALTELRLSNSSLATPDTVIRHLNIREIFLSLNTISDFSSVMDNIIATCPRLETLSLSDCPISRLCEAPTKTLSLRKLNLSDSRIASWEEVEKIKTFTSLTDLRIMDCPFNADLDELAKRQEVIARLPNIQTLNGGDKISAGEREEAERNFIRSYLHLRPDSRPERWAELVEVHGNLEPLVKIDLTPETLFRVGVWYGETERVMTVSVRQRVRHFKSLLARHFPVSPSCMRLWYYDQDLWSTAGPQEMKFPEKGLYTYRLRHGDYFVVERRHGQECSNSCTRTSPSKKRHKLAQPKL